MKADYLNSAIASRTFTIERDVDADNNGLIEIRNLDMLDNIRHDLAGTSYKTSGTDPGSSAGASTTEPDNCDDDNASNHNSPLRLRAHAES